MLKITETILASIDHNIQFWQATESSQIWPLIEKYYRTNMTYEEVSSSEEMSTPRSSMVDMVVLVTLGEIALLLGMPDSANILDTRKFAMECFKQARIICAWLTKWMEESQDSLTDSSRIVMEYMLAFHDETKMYCFNAKDADGDLMIPVTKGFCQSLSQENGKNMKIGIYENLLIVDTAYLAPMLRYFDRMENKI